MKMYIPEIGDKIKLLKDWSFELFCEYRNYELFEKFQTPIPRIWNGTDYNYSQSLFLTFIEGTVLSVDRIYIRKGASDFSSISFYIEDSPEEKFKPGKKKGFKKGKLRFWAKLCDVNNMEIEKI